MKSKHTYFLKLKILVLATVFSVLITSCGGSSKSEMDSASNYRLEVFDSLQFDILSTGLRVLDVDTKTGNQLIVQGRPTKAYIFSREGEILVEKEFEKSDPKGPGNYLMSGTFFGKGVAFLGQYNVSFFDENLEFQKVIRPHYTSQMHYIGKKHIYQFTTEQGEPRLVTFFGEAQTELWGGLEDYYDEFNVVDVVDPSQYSDPRYTVFMPIGGFTADSKYRNGNAFYFVRPVFDVKENTLHYVLDNDTTLFRMSLPDGEIVESYTIPYDEFVIFNGFSMGSEGEAEQNKPRDREGEVEQVFRLGEFDLIQYRSGVELSEMMKYINEPDPGEVINKLNYWKHIIVKDGKRMNKDLIIDERVSSLQFADDQGVVYGTQNLSILDEEPEVYTIYKLRIVADDQ